MRALTRRTRSSDPELTWSASFSSAQVQRHKQVGDPFESKF
jgi:hypothetical protein